MKRPQLLVCAGLALVAVSPAIAGDGEDYDGATMRIVEILIRFDSCSLVAVAEAVEVVVEAAPEPFYKYIISYFDSKLYKMKLTTYRSIE